MTGPYGDTRLCASLTREELDGTFFYPGPLFVSSPPSGRSQTRWDRAKEICIECPVFLSCRQNRWGQEYGVWGGLDEHERYLYRRSLMRALGRMTPPQRAALAERLFHACGGARAPRLVAVSLRTGYTVPTLKGLLAEHAEALKDRARRREDAARAAREAVGAQRPEDWAETSNAA